MSHTGTDAIVSTSGAAIMTTAEWYFDFVSPFSYLQLESFGRLPADLAVTCRPVLLGGLFNHWDLKGPAEIPVKRRFTARFVQWRAERAGVPLKFPPAHPFNPIKPLRLAIALGCDVAAVQTIFRAIWRDGQAVDDSGHWEALCRDLGLPDADSRINDSKVKDELKRNGERAVAAGVFGVPTFVIDGEIFWGDDATEMVIDYLREPQRFQRGEFQRVVDLPVGVQRVPK
jgi:2-hydroxychromene-2-carboxylate isomerase